MELLSNHLQKGQVFRLPPILAELFSKIQVNSRVQRFSKRFELMTFLNQANIRKEKGLSLANLIQFLISLVFTHKNFYRFMNGKDQEPKTFGKDVIYRFLNNPKADWRKFQLLLSSKIVNGFLSPLTSAKRCRVLIFDDSFYDRNRSKKVELLARVFDHTTHKYVRGFRKLTAGWSDGTSFVPMAFALLSSAVVKNRIYEQGAEIPANCPGVTRRKEAVSSATVVLLELLDQVLEYTQAFQFVLFDSWFSWPKVIDGIRQRDRHVICMLKDMPKLFYGLKGKRYRLSDLYAQVTKRKGASAILASVIVDYYGTPARVVFVRNREGQREWLALLCTDLKTSEEEVVRIYGMRWDIEVYFKVCKSFLRLAKEFQGRSYDMLVAHTTLVCVRYLILTVENREGQDDRAHGALFYDFCDEVKDVSFCESIKLILGLLTQAVHQVFLPTDEILDRLIQVFIDLLPLSMKNQWTTSTA